MTVLQSILCILALCSISACRPWQDRPAYVLRGTWHHVSAADTLRGLARKYGVSQAVLRELNDVADDRSLRQRDVLFIPLRDGKTPGRGREGRQIIPAGGTTTPAVEPGRGERASKRCGQEGRPCLLWPVKGPVAAYFGEKQGVPHDGIDIRAEEGTPIRAAESGVVLYSGNQIKGYGNMVIIRHDDGLITVYAHNAQNLVEEGKRVTRGDTIGKVGHTGAAEVSHLHFEVRKAEQPTDPMGYLNPPPD